MRNNLTSYRTIRFVLSVFKELLKILLLAMELIQQVGASVHQVELDPVYFEKLSFGVLNDAQPTKEN